MAKRANSVLARELAGLDLSALVLESIEQWGIAARRAKIFDDTTEILLVVVTGGAVDAFAELTTAAIAKLAEEKEFDRQLNM